MSRLETPGLCSGSKMISRPVSVTADRIFFADIAGSSSRSTTPAGDDADFDIFAVGCCRSAIFAVSLRMYGAGTTNVAPNVVLNRCARSRVSSRCWRWSSPTGTGVGLVEQDVGGLQDRVGEQADAGPIGALLAATCP